MQTSITCTNCWRTSYHPRDVLEGFCGNCNQYFPDGVVCRDATHSPHDTRFVYVWHRERILVIIKHEDDGYCHLTAASALRFPVKDIGDYTNVFRVAEQEIPRIRRKKTRKS